MTGDVCVERIDLTYPGQIFATIMEHRGLPLVFHFHIARIMEKNHTLTALSALAHDIRLDVFRLLIQAGPEGMAAGEIAAALDVRANTLSNNLTILSTAGLVRGAREGRSIRYFAGTEVMRDLLGFLMQDCCGGRPDLCDPVLDQIAAACCRENADE